MAPGPQEQSVRVEARAPRGDAPPADTAVVISGMSGLLPDCHNIDEFSRKLYDKENMVKKHQYRWKYEHPEILEHIGRIPKLARFDAQFFKVHYRLGHSLDAMARKVMENTYTAIFDAGLSTTELAIKRVGVFMAVDASESGLFYSSPNGGLGLVGANRAMIANRVSYCLNLRGPSMVLDGSCCGSFVAFEKAYQSITTGECEAAVVGACRVMLHPQTIIHHHRLMPKSEDGKTRCYDSHADGHTLSEAINVFLLQKYKDSKRVYATLCHAKARFGTGDDWNFAERYRHEHDSQHMVKFLQEFYNEAGIPPSVVEFVDGCGTAVPFIDKMELEAIEEVFCKDRSTPLLVGSVSSNIGFTGAASGTSSVVKLLLAYQRGELASNLYCDSPRQDIAALREGRMRIVTGHQRFRPVYTAVNGVAINGLNGHALLQGHYKPKNLSQYHSEIPYLVTVSGRRESAVKKLIDNLKTHKLDAEEIALIHNIFKIRNSGHLARGFGIFSTNDEGEPVTLSEDADYYDDAQRPLWFVYSGMGSQWAGMGAQLMRIPIFAAAIERCRKVLEPKGVDIVHILTSPDKTIYDNIMHSFVGIAAVQIGLTDVLTSIGLVPDKIIGHSVGELGCAYADGGLTAEEMILAAYSRGRVSLETPFIVGSMAAVGLGYKQVLEICPPEIEVACHNGPESSTISGPAAVMREFVAHLTSKGIFAKEVPCSNIAYHSRYIAKAGPGLHQYLSEVIPTPRRRSERWVSTSVPRDRWHEEVAKYSSAEYHTNNLLNPVLFEETSRLIPSNAVVVEIAPHGLLQAILKKSLPVSCENIALTRRGHVDNTLFLLQAIGRVYMKGYDVDLAALYPPVQFPVSTETPMLSHLVEWVYDEIWRLSSYITSDKRYSTLYMPIITIYDDEYLAGHIIGGSRLYPFAAGLVSAWDTLAMTLSKPLRTLAVEYRDIRFHSQPRLLSDKALHLTVSLMRGSGHFEVSSEYGPVVEGIIVALPNQFSKLDLPQVENESMILTSSDIYKLLHERGYDYRGDFRSIHKMNSSFDQAQMVWKSNWVTLIDGLIQFHALRRPHGAISQPTHIKTLSINPFLHSHNTNTDHYVDAKLTEAEVTQCGGVTMTKISFIDKPYIIRQAPALKTLKFFPFFLNEDADILTTLYIFMQIIAENIPGEVLKIFDLTCCNQSGVIENLKNILASAPEIKHEVTPITRNELLALKSKTSKADVLLVHDLLSDKHTFETLYQCLPPNTFIVSVGVETQGLYPSALYRLVCARGKGSKKIELALWRPSPSASSTAITVRNSSEMDFLQSTCSVLPPQHTLLILTCYPPPLGLKDIVKQQRKGYNRKINVAMIDQKVTEENDLDHLPSFDLSYNLLRNGEWGGNYYLPLPKMAATGQPIELRSAQIGNLDSLNWVEVPELVDNGLAVTVHYAALSTYDTKRARAEISNCNDNNGFGMDFSGITDSGHRVFGVVRGGAGALSSRVRAQQELLWPVPSHWDLEDAATVALPYLQAFYCLAIKSQLREGMSILIHSGAGALGQAAISIALALRCEVFTTVSDIRKKNFLKQLFPNLKGSNIGNSRDNSFMDMVLSATNGAGCHVVINNLQGELRNASLSCCRQYGITLDVCQIHTRENFSFGMFHMTQERSYAPIDFSLITEGKNLEELQELQLMMSEGIAAGFVRPLSRVTFAPQEAARAFRFLAGGHHRGRVLLRMLDANLASLAQPRLVCSDDSQQLLICDEEVMSLQLVDRLINRGAKRLRLYLPKSSAYLNVKKAAWNSRGVHIDTVYGGVWDKEKLMQFLHDSKRAGLVESLFFIIRDYEHKSMMKSTLQSLDITSRELFHTLKHFTVISENRYFGRDICYDRALCGIPSLSLQMENLEKFDELGYDNDKLPTAAMQWPNAVEIIERALCSREEVVFGYAQAVSNRTLLEEIARIPGVSITSATDPSSTLEQVGVDQGRAQELFYLLQEKFDIALPKETLPQMTISQFQKLQEHFTNTDKEDSGLKAYIKTINEDEMVAATELVLMRTLGCSSEMRPDEFDMTQTYLCIIPGMEGQSDRFRILCERLKLPALVLQPSNDVEFDNVRDMAQRHVNVMMLSLKKKNTKSFYLLGYELGVQVALEMAAILESYGLVGTVFCLGGTPDDIRTSLEIDLGNISEDALLQHLTTLLGYKDENLIEALEKEKKLKEKIEICVNRNKAQVIYTSQFMRCYLRAAYNRLQLLWNHRPQPLTLRSKIIVMQTELPSELTRNSMAEFSQQPVTVHKLRTSLAHAPKNLQCSSIINKYIDPELLEKFKTRNLCVTHSAGEVLVDFV